MRVVQKFSPNYCERITIDPKFVVLHYTACSLEKVFKLFFREPRKESGLSETEKIWPCSHLIIDYDGTAYEIVPTFGKKVAYCRHSGESRYFYGKESFEKFNNFSIGIEIVNLNGNIFPYTDSQYNSLKETFLKLALLYPTLSNVDRIIGHEHIAGFRGKVDPGWMFDWERLYRSLPPQFGAAKSGQVNRAPVLSKRLLDSLRGKADPTNNDDQYWIDLSLWLEKETHTEKLGSSS
ncbi:MAG TPA: N-acetylmuramoyl-L-alanine amidase [Oligoflexia bacterium]|nr:N-acetylmuramoyl-L-alanine amidase [Oligoflexia bacterium]HMP26950.1 N-acetylmuramoyl-L-alanine amidase [Oligoflexia bacterium]